MINKIILRATALVLVLLAGLNSDIKAQTFYEIEYTDKEDCLNRGLFIYYDEEDCTVIMRHHDADGDVASIDQWEYQSVKDNADGVNYMIMACEEDGTPLFTWIWDKNETEEQQEIPYVVLDENDDTDEWIRASLFFEDNINYLTPEYLELFLDPECELYQQMTAAYQEHIAGLDDGKDVYGIISQAVEASRGEEENDVDAYTGASAVTQTTDDDEDATVDDETANTVTGKGRTGAWSISANRPVMHLIVVANTDIYDIGQACSTDYKNIVSEMRGIAQSLGISLKEYSITGSNYSISNLKRQLKVLRPSSNDIVVFLYTGHGFRFTDQSDPYPMLALTTNDYQPLEGNYIAISDIYNTLCKKGARLNIVLGDCCNSELEEVQPLECNTLFSRGSNNFSLKRLQELFFKSEGSILSTAASPGEYSWCDSSGGMFTISFIQSLRKEISSLNKNAVSWQSVVNNTINSARRRSQNNATAQNGLKRVTVKKL